MKRIVFVVVLCTVVLFLAPLSRDVRAFSETDVGRLKTTMECENCDLDGAGLSWAFLRDARLNGARLRGAQMEGARLRGAQMEGADLRGANLSRANLREANMRGANLYGANLTNARLEGTIFTQAIWTDGRKCGVGSVEKCN